MVSFNDLPDEIVLIIFRCCSTFDLLQCRYVCSRWKQVAEDPILYQTITIDDKMFQYDVEYLFKKYHKSIKCLHLIRRNDLGPLVSYINFNLKYLRIRTCTGYTEKYYVTNVENFQKLKFLIIYNSEFIPSDLFKIIKDNYMYEIRICYSKLKDILVEDFWLNRTEILKLVNVNISVSGIIKFCRNNFDNLGSLKLITDDAIHHETYSNARLFFEAICSCQHLEVLWLQHPAVIQLDDDIISYLYKLDFLKSFMLCGTRLVTASGFIRFFERSSAKNLLNIRLHYCLNVDYSVIETIAKNCKHLEMFSYNRNKHDYSMKTEDILLLIEECSKLKNLYLYGMNFNRVNLLNIIPYSSNLQLLNYSCKMNEEIISGIINTLQKEMPKFEVLRNLNHRYVRNNLKIKCIRKK